MITYIYIAKVVASKRKQEIDLKSQTLESYKNELFNLKKKLAIIKNVPYYLDISYQIDSLNAKKDVCELMINDVYQRKGELLEKKSNNLNEQKKIKNKNIILRLFYRKRLKLLKQEFDYLNNDLTKIEEEALEMQNKNQLTLNMISEKKRHFSKYVGFEITFDEFKLEEDKLSGNYKSDYMIEKEILSLQENITELSKNLSMDMEELNKFCKEHGIENLDKKSNIQNLS